MFDLGSAAVEVRRAAHSVVAVVPHAVWAVAALVEESPELLAAP